MSGIARLHSNSLKEVSVRAFLAAVAMASLVGCATNPVTEREQLMLISESQVLTSSELAYQRLVADAASRQSLNADVQLVERVQQIAFRIIPHAVRFRPAVIDWRWEINVLQSETPNAFCMAGGKIGVNTAIVNDLNLTDDEIAQVIGHEVAHALSEHTREKISVAIASGMFANIVIRSKSMNEWSAQAVQTAIELAVTLPNSRLAETEADSIGMLLATNAGYDPKAAASLWNKMLMRSGEARSSIVSTHPLPSERITSLNLLAAKMYPRYVETVELRLSDKLPKVEYEAGKIKNLYEQGKYELPKNVQ